MWRWRSRNANDESSRGVVELAVDDAATCRLLIHSCDAYAIADNDNDSPRQLEQPSQEPVHVHFFFHGSLLAAHHSFLHPTMIVKEVYVSRRIDNKLRSPSAFDLLVWDAVVTVFVVETACRDGRVGVEV